MGEQTEAYYGNYFAVSLLYQSVHNGAAADDHWFEESIVLIRATGQSESEETADRYARSQEAAYRSATGDAVQWKWLGITGIFAVSDPVSAPDGTAEVFSRMLKRQEIPAAFLPPPAAAA